MKVKKLNKSNFEKELNHFNDPLNKNNVIKFLK